MKTASRTLTRWVAAAELYDVLTLAMQMERGAICAYTAMAKAGPTPLVRAKLRYLLAEERDHLRLLSALKRTVPKPKKPHKPPASLSEVGTPDKTRSHKAAVRLAARSEQKAEALYRTCAERCRRPAPRALFNQLAEQEARHAVLLGEELALLTAGTAWSSLEGAPPVEDDFWVQR